MVVFAVGACLVSAALCTSAASRALLSILSAFSAPASLADLRTSQAIVVLGGASDRIAVGASLYKAVGTPILITGGVLLGSGVTEAQYMATTLERDYGIVPRWIENEARGTDENASRARCILREAGIHRIALVTGSIHMLRARLWFEHAGFQVISAPAMLRWPHHRFEDFIPSAEGWNQTKLALHEWIGILAFMTTAPAYPGGCP